MEPGGDMRVSGRERRAGARYPIRLELRYRLIQRNLVVAEGPARTENIGSRGILLIADRTFAPGAFLELSIDWPLLRDGIHPIQLLVTGRVVRSTSQGTALKALSHDSCVFRLKEDTGTREPVGSNKN